MHTHEGNPSQSSKDAMKRENLSLSVKVDGNLPDLRILKCIWGELPKSEQSKFEAQYGYIVDLLDVKVDFGLIKAFMDFYDPTVRGFVFPDVVLVPTIEEYAILLGRLSAEECYFRPLDLKHRDLSRTLSNIIGLPVQMMYKYQETRRSTTGVDWLRLKDEYFTKEKRIKQPTGVISQFLALGMYALVLFPSAKKMADENVIKAFGIFQKTPWKLEPVILSETLRALNEVQRKGKGRLKCCVELLYVWMMSHLPTILDARSTFSSGYFSGGRPIKEFTKAIWPVKGVNEWREYLSTLKAEHLILSPRWCRSCSYLYRSGSNQWLPLIGIRGIISYAPVLAARQFEDQQGMPDLTGLERIEFKFDGTVENERRIIEMERLWEERQSKNWVRSRITCHPAYVDWHRRKFHTSSSNKGKRILEQPTHEPTKVAKVASPETIMAKLAEVVERLEAENDRLKGENTSISQAQKDEILQRDVEIGLLRKKVEEQEREIEARRWEKEEYQVRLTDQEEQYEDLRQQVNTLAIWGIKVIPRIQRIRTLANWWTEHFPFSSNCSLFDFLQEIVSELEDFIMYKK